MKAFQIFELHHRGKDCLGVRLERGDSRNESIKKIASVRWSQTHKCWYAEKTAGLEVELLKVLGPFENSVQFFEDPPAPETNLPVEDGDFEANIKESEGTNQHVSPFPNADETACVEKMVQHMKVIRFSENSISNYKNHVMVFLKYFHNRDWRTVNQYDIEVFQKEVVIDRNLSPAYQQGLISAIKKFYEANTKKKPTYDFIIRPKKAKTLPNVLSLEEIKRLLTSLENFKHRMMLSTIYACGLRAGDLINLKPSDIQSDRGMLHIKGGKGNKDRVVPISAKLVEQLREYYKIYKPVKWLFEGQEKGSQYTHRSLQQVLQKALEKAKIFKKVKLHDLRHSYATHLMEAGTNQRLIQEALGHKSSKTTDIYTHVSKTNLGKMYNPFDDLNM